MATASHRDVVAQLLLDRGGQPTVLPLWYPAVVAFGCPVAFGLLLLLCYVIAIPTKETKTKTTCYSSSSVRMEWYSVPDN